MTEEADKDMHSRLMPGLRSSLSARLLLLTVLFVMIAEVFAFAPSVGRAQRDFLLQKLSDAKQEVEDAKKVASELVSVATSEIEAIKTKIEVAVEQEIAYLEKSYDDKSELDTRKVKKEVVENVLNQLLTNENIALSQKDLADIILKKVA